VWGKEENSWADLLGPALCALVLRLVSPPLLPVKVLTVTAIVEPGDSKLGLLNLGKRSNQASVTQAELEVENHAKPPCLQLLEPFCWILALLTTGNKATNEQERLARLNSPSHKTKFSN